MSKVWRYGDHVDTDVIIPPGVPISKRGLIKYKTILSENKPTLQCRQCKD